MASADQQITDILGKYGEPFAGNVWRVQGNAVIYHKALERIAAQAQIRFDPPTIIRAERDEAVMLVTGRMGERTEWSVGEALINVNYRVSGRQAAYVFAMAEKRAKDRVILKLIELHGLLYSEEEADDFKDAAPAANPRQEGAAQVDGVAPAPSTAPDAEAIIAKVKEHARALKDNGRTFSELLAWIDHPKQKAELDTLSDGEWGKLSKWVSDFKREMSVSTMEAG
jgi:hypothetical protein